MDEEAMADDWHVRTALALEHAFPGRYALECWRPDWREKHTKQANVRGLACRIFPSRRAPFDKFSYEVSLPLLGALWRKARRERFILHVHEMHSTAGILAAFLPGGAVKAAHTHGTPPVGLRLQVGRPLAKRLPLGILLPLENAALGHYRHLFAIADKELDYLRGRGLPASKLTMGVDFETFVPRDKAQARERLGLPRDARIVLYTGRNFRLKGVDALLNAMDEVRVRDPRACLVMVGGLPQDELHREVAARADRNLGRVPASMMPDYLASCDLCVPNVADPGLLGIGMATVEAWAMDVPVLTSALGEFPGVEAERALLGVHFRPGRGDLSQAIQEGLALSGRISPRETARQHYDWPVIAAQVAKVYDRIWETTSQLRVEEK
jgi:glycosyltransferase involved in cell wall biosynthesis